MIELNHYFIPLLFRASVNQLVNLSIIHPIDQSYNRSFIYSVSQLINQSTS